MTLHPLLSADLLDMEVDATRSRHGGRFAGIERVGTGVFCTLEDTSVGNCTIRFDGANYDAEPFRVVVVDGGGEVAPADAWPTGLCGGSHPLLGYPFTCIRGTFEYHAHPSHLSDSWDGYRSHLRLPQLVAHILKRCGK